MTPDSKEVARASIHLSICLQQAHDLGVVWARGMIGKTEAKEGVRTVIGRITQKAQQIVAHFLDTIGSWFAADPDDEDIASEFDPFVENIADETAQYEVVAAMEQAVLDTWQDAKIPQVVWIAMPDACPTCQTNEEQGAIVLGDIFSSGDAAPPGHPRCRCVLGVP